MSDREAFENWLKNENIFSGNDDNEDVIWAKNFMFKGWQSQQAKIDELQARVDGALKILKDWDDQSYRDDMDQLTGEIEDILKGNKDENY
jgi:hypothetical protein